MIFKVMVPVATFHFKIFQFVHFLKHVKIYDWAYNYMYAMASVVCTSFLMSIGIWILKLSWNEDPLREYLKLEFDWMNSTRGRYFHPANNFQHHVRTVVKKKKSKIYRYLAVIDTWEMVKHQTWSTISTSVILIIHVSWFVFELFCTLCCVHMY